MPKPRKNQPQRRRTALELNPSLGEKIIEDVAAGLGLEDSARASGVHPDTVRSWVEFGQTRAAPEILQEFAIRYERAKVSPIRKAIHNVMTHIETGNLTAAQFWLAKIDPRFKDTVKIEADVTLAPKYDLKRLNPDELRQWRALALKATTDG